MALSTYAQKLLNYFGIYHITATQYDARLSGGQDYYYNVNWFADLFATEAGKKPRQNYDAPKRGIFKTALAELVSGGY
jgi:hypothetical protein